MTVKLYYLHDPMCSWCWGYRPAWDKLQSALPSSVQVQYVCGGLAPDSNVEMPFAQQEMIQQHWRVIEKKLATKFNFDFWQNNTPRRSTYNSCRAAIAANRQGFQLAMIDAIQQGYYLRALNPSDNDILVTLAKSLAEQFTGFDLSTFVDDLGSESVEQELMRQIDFSRALSQQGFPSLVLEVNGEREQLAIDYTDYQLTLDTIKQHITNKGG